MVFLWYLANWLGGTKQQHHIETLKPDTESTSRFFGVVVGKSNYSHICTWLSTDSVRVCINQDLVGQSDKREESTIQQCNIVEFISKAQLLGR